MRIAIPGAVFAKTIISCVRIFINMVDSYVATIIRKLVFPKQISIVAVQYFVINVWKYRVVFVSWYSRNSYQFLQLSNSPETYENIVVVLLALHNEAFVRNWTLARASPRDCDGMPSEWQCLRLQRLRICCYARYRNTFTYNFALHAINYKLFSILTEHNPV